jgi:hypothetical protein
MGKEHFGDYMKTLIKFIVLGLASSFASQSIAQELMAAKNLSVNKA